MKVNLMHGAGGEVMGELLTVLTRFSNKNAGGIGLESLDDGAVIPSLPPIPTWSVRSFSREAISAGYRCAGR
jgi:hypothetical protein